MSLILEALRKSEAERRRGQVPNLHAELPPAAQSARSRRPAWPWLVALAIIAMVATTWLERGWWAPTPPAAEPVRPASTDHAVPARADSTDADTGPTDAAVPVGDATPPAIEPPDISAPIADVIPAAEPPAKPTAVPIDSAATAQRRPEPAAPPTRDTGSDSGRVSAPAAAAAPPTAVPVPRPTEPAATPPATPAAADATATAVDKPAPLRLSDLAAAERRALPSLQISMHMWAPTSPRRFAIIDGARVNEGDRLGDAVVDEITRDGVVLAWRGRRVHIPIQ